MNEAEIIKTNINSKYPNLAPSFSIFKENDQSKIIQTLLEIGVENFMLQGWVNDPELSKFLTVYHNKSTVLAERLDMAYAIYTRATELLKLDFNHSEKDFLQELQQSALTHVCLILNVDLDDIDQVHLLMEDRAEQRLKDYEYIPGKATDYWQPLTFKIKKSKETTRTFYQIIEEAGLSEHLSKFEKGKNMSASEKTDFLSVFFRILNKKIGWIEKTIKSSDEKYKNKHKNDVMALRLLVNISVNIFCKMYNIEKKNDACFYLDSYSSKNNLVDPLKLTQPDYWTDIPEDKIDFLLEKQSKELSLQQNNNSILRSVDLDSLWKDIELNATYYYDPRKRDKFRVIIKSGTLIRENRDLKSKSESDIIDTTNMLGHKGYGWCAFTLNLKGELSVFNHLKMEADEQNHIHAHTSMNAGDVVVSAGEMIISKNGHITTISDYSGHYLPQPYNIYLLLKHLKNQRADVDDTDIVLMNKIEGLVGKEDGKQYFYKGSDVYNHFKNLDQELTQTKSLDNNVSQSPSLSNTILKYIHDTDVKTKHPYYKHLHLKDSFFKKASHHQDFVGATQVKNQIAKNLLYNIKAHDNKTMSHEAFTEHLKSQMSLLKSFRCTKSSKLMRILTTCNDNVSAPKK